MTLLAVRGCLVWGVKSADDDVSGGGGDLDERSEGRREEKDTQDINLTQREAAPTWFQIKAKKVGAERRRLIFKLPNIKVMEAS